MKSTTKGMLATIPLIIGLAGPAAAALAESADTGGSNGTEISIDSLLNQYSGLMPGDQDMAAVLQEILPSQKLTTFTRAASSMNTGYTNQGVDRTSPNQPSRSIDYIVSNSTAGNNGSERDAAVAAPAVAAITSAHATQDSLVGAVASSIAPSSSGGINPDSISVAGDAPLVPVPVPEPIPTPIPPAAALIGSGLTALAALRKRNQVTLA